MYVRSSMGISSTLWFTLLLTKRICLPGRHGNTILIGFMHREVLHLYGICNLVIILSVIQLRYICKLRRVQNNFAAHFGNKRWSCIVEVISDADYAWRSFDMKVLTASEVSVFVGDHYVPVADIGRSQIHSFKTQMAEVKKVQRSNR